MILFLTQAVFIITGFYLVYFLILKRFTFFNFNRSILLVGIILAFVMPTLPLNFSEEQTEYVYLSKEQANILQSNKFSENVLSSPKPESNLTFIQSLTITDWLIIAYWIGFLLFLFNMIFQLGMVFWMMRKGRGQYKEGVKLIFTNKDVSPFSFFSNIIVNPDKVNEKQWNDVIVHEKVHISQWHQIDVVLAEILKTVLWFLPISWWYAKEIRTNLEYIADDISIQNGLNRKNYQLSLVQISQQNAGPQLVNSFSKKIVKNRIKMLNKMKSNKNVLAAYSLVIPLLLLMSVLVSAQAQGQEKKVKKVIVITEDGKSKEDVKVTYKGENGKTVEVDSNDVEVVNLGEQSNHVISSFKIDSLGNGNKTYKIVKSLLDSSSTIYIENLEDQITINGDRMKIQTLEGNDSLIVISDKMSLKNGSDHKIIINGNEIILDKIKVEDYVNGMDSYEYDFPELDSLDIDLEKIFEDNDLNEIVNNSILNEMEMKYFNIPEVKGNEMFYYKGKAGKLNISEEEYNKLSKKQKRQLDKIQKELDKKSKEKNKSYSFKSIQGNSPYVIKTSISQVDINDPIVIIDGKQSTIEKMNALDSDEIESINVIKEDSGINLYGDKAKNGIIKIETKKAKTKQSI